VPFSLSGVPESQHFIARDQELVDIRETLHGGQDRFHTAGDRTVAILHGLGGIGKTQLAVAHAKRYRHSYSSVLWFNIKDDQSIRSSFRQVAAQIQQAHPSAFSISLANGDTDETIVAVKAWLSRPWNTRWLLIYDNYDTPDAIDIAPFFPDAYQGAVVVTTRISDLQFGHTIAIRKITNQSDGLEILARYSKRRGALNGEPCQLSLQISVGFFVLTATQTQTQSVLPNSSTVSLLHWQPPAHSCVRVRCPSATTCKCTRTRGPLCSRKAPG
jgi:hypothetical protein